MPQNVLKNSVLSLAVWSLAVAGLPSMAAKADDLNWSKDPADFNAPIGDPVLPSLSSAADGPDVVMPQLNGGTGPTAALPAGANPFAQQPAVAAKAIVGVTLPAASANPFAVVTASVPTAPDTSPFALGGPSAIATSPLDGKATGIDETALRYYAGQRDLPRVGAEIRRIKALHPDWEPPADLFTPTSDVNEQPLWDLFAAGQFDVERQQIDALKASNASWVPSADLITKLEDAEARAAMNFAYTVANWTQVIAVAQSRNSLLVCGHIDALWQLAEAFARVGNLASSFDVYKYILGNCGDETQRLSSVQKAARLLPQKGIDALVAMGRSMPDGTLEFDSIGLNTVRGELNAAINDEVGDGWVDPNQLERFAAYVRTTRQPDDMGLIGWYYYATKEWHAAYAWFAAGARISKDPKLLEGEALALRAGGQLEQALRLVTVVRKRSPELDKQYIELVSAILSDASPDVTLTDDELKAFQDIVTEEKSALGAQAVGWHYLASDNLIVAKTWFDDFMEWGETEGGVIGKAVIASRSKQYVTLAALKTQYTTKYPGLASFKVYKTKSSYSKKR